MGLAFHLLLHLALRTYSYYYDHMASISVPDHIYRLARKTHKASDLEVATASLLSAIASGPPKPTIPYDGPVDEEKVDRLYRTAITRLIAVDGEWIRWQKLRPAYRDRSVYENVLWERLVEDPIIETQESPHGVQIRRQARFISLV